MAIHCVRPDISGEFRNPFDCDELIVKASSPSALLWRSQTDALTRPSAMRR